MIEFEKKTLDNGLKVIVHTDKTTPLVALNVVYDVGARDESPEKTGFAHLFEHLMFGGSKNIPNYDGPLEQIGGENNAFTTNDITNYYLTVPAENIETGFWLESDRMLELAFTPNSLEVQRKVVIEEFKQRYLNQPYGDVSKLLKELAYKKHPYQWPTIGKEISHIEEATLDDVKHFFYSHYAPNNAVLSITGNISAHKAFNLAEKWFSDIPKREIKKRNLPAEPKQTKARTLTVYRDVPYNGLYMAFHMTEKLHEDYFTTDLISDILSNGDSSRLYRRLVIDQGIFTELDAYISGDNDPGLFMVTGKLVDGIDIKMAEKMIWHELDQMKHEEPNKDELQKVINKVSANLEYSEISFLNKAISLGSYELLKDANLINKQLEMYQNVTPQKVKKVANKLFCKNNSSTLYYLKKQ